MTPLLKKILASVLLCGIVSSANAASPFNQLIGVDYQPNHYSPMNKFNFHDVFYVGNNSAGKPITNVYQELVQLKAAGFTTVRSYQTDLYSWVDIINQAHALGLKVVYEANIPQSGNQTDINAAKTLLTAVIAQVGLTTFNQTVILVFAGHENLSATNENYLANAVTALKIITTVPVGSALLSGDLIGPAPNVGVVLNSYSLDAPYAYDPYPFQWGVTTPTLAVTATSLMNSIAWDYDKVFINYPAYANSLLMAESGWATAGLGNYANYFCAPPHNNPTICKPSISNASKYLTALYAYVLDPIHKAGVLVFEAYDEPAKPYGMPPKIAPNDAEHFYGVFDKNCKQKAAGLIPKNTLVTELGCQGYANGSLLTLVGYGKPYTIHIVQNNPLTHKDASITLTGNGKPGPFGSTDWPHFLVFSGAKITIRGNPSCTSTVTAIDSAQKISFKGKCNCSNKDNNCYY